MRHYNWAEIGERVKHVRELHAQITQEDLARKAHVTLELIGTIENGEKIRSMDLLCIAIALKCSMDWLISGEVSVCNLPDDWRTHPKEIEGK